MIPTVDDSIPPMPLAAPSPDKSPTVQELSLMDPNALVEALSTLEPAILRNIVQAAKVALSGSEETGTQAMANESPDSLVP